MSVELVCMASKTREMKNAWTTQAQSKEDAMKSNFIFIIIKA